MTIRIYAKVRCRGVGCLGKERGEGGEGSSPFPSLAPGVCTGRPDLYLYPVSQCLFQRITHTGRERYIRTTLCLCATCLVLGWRTDVLMSGDS